MPKLQVGKEMVKFLAISEHQPIAILPRRATAAGHRTRPNPSKSDQIRVTFLLSVSQPLPERGRPLAKAFAVSGTLAVL